MPADVLICGAGPAGSLAAILLARAGVRVRILDRARFPRDKICGDTVNPGALRVLSRHGVERAVRGGLPVEGMIVTGPGGVRVEGRYGGGAEGRAIRRRHFDAHLAQAAVDAGADLEEGVTVTGAIVDTAASRVTGVLARPPHGRARELEARLVIAADGGQSRIGRRLGLSVHPAAPRRWAVSACFDGVAGLTAFGEMHLRSNGYIGVAPLPGGLANACLVTADRSALKDPSRLLCQRLRGDRWLGERFAAARPASATACCGPLAVECPTPGMPGLLFAGDAAGFIDPMTGDGLRFALRGAELAAAEALRALESGSADAHVRLAAARAEAFGRKWRFNRTLRSLVGSPAAIRVADRGAALAPGVVRGLIRYAADLHVA